MTMELKEKRILNTLGGTVPGKLFYYWECGEELSLRVL